MLSEVLNCVVQLSSKILNNHFKYHFRLIADSFIS